MDELHDDPCDDWSEHPFTRLRSSSKDDPRNTSGMDLVRLPRTGGIRFREILHYGSGVQTGRFSAKG